MMPSPDKVCLQENELTDRVCADCVSDYPCYMDQAVLADDFEGLLKDAGLKDIAKPFVMFIK